MVSSSRIHYISQVSVCDNDDKHDVKDTTVHLNLADWLPLSFLKALAADFWTNYGLEKTLDTITVI